MVYINAISYHFPEKSITNDELITDFNSNWNREKINISSEELYKQCWVNKRYISSLDETAKDLGNAAANKLFKEWNINRNEIEYLIFVSDALEYKGPTTACIMQYDLDLAQTCAAIDVLHGCTGFIYGLSLAKALIDSEQVKNVLLITADVPTKVIHPKDIDLRAIFSDAAAATLISNKKITKGINAQFNKFTFGTDGSGAKSLFVEHSATKEPADIKWLSQFIDVPTGLEGGRLTMNSSKIFLFALKKVPQLVKDILIKENLTFSDIDYFVLHQANGQMLDFIRKKLNIEEEKFIINIQEIGNTVSASIPIALSQMFKENKLKKGQQILISGFGIGLSWGGTILTI
ncbi:MAG: ketoacyl-ACP synthase III [Vicingaceae bacterium]|nr:ketoacyl-ACP synthase III [Vicingaceae bacterium]